MVMPLIVFMLVPIVEMWILIEVGGWIGALPTIGLVVVTATLGLSLLKRQGLSTLLSARQKMNEGSIPATELVSGVMLAVGGALLLTPGFVTDMVGLVLLIPQTRQWLLFKMIDRFRDKITIEGEYRRLDDRNF
ncbi:MAG TPA: exlusion protein FxsA [Gammaproteobacteria bacterium]|nr:exlusion protein FxsA [Gammaproteobacteria bacterium]